MDTKQIANLILNAAGTSLHNYMPSSQEHILTAAAQVQQAAMPVGDAWTVEEIDQMREVAKRHGYTLALHGSQKRDLDLIAVPWTDEATDACKVAFAICDVFKGKMHPSEQNHPHFMRGAPGLKPHGRRGWVFFYDGKPPIDLSIMPLAETEDPTAAANPAALGKGRTPEVEQIMAIMQPIIEAAPEITAGNLTTAEIVEEECPMCDGQGNVDGEQYINIDGKPPNILFTGIGPEFGEWNKLFHAICKALPKLAALQRGQGEAG